MNECILVVDDDAEIVGAIASTTIAAAVSSQDDSIESIVVLIMFPLFLVASLSCNLSYSIWLCSYLTHTTFVSYSAACVVAEPLGSWDSVQP